MNWQLVLGIVAVPLLFLAGWSARTGKALHDHHRIVNYYEQLLTADIVQQHVYMDRAALIYVAVCSSFAYVGQTMQDLEKRVYQHGRGTSHFDKTFARNKEQWEWFILDQVPATYRYAAERAWIQRYIALGYTLMNGNDGTEDGLVWELDNDTA